jgi:hypothetical protein
MRCTCAANCHRYRTNLKLWEQDYETVYVDGFVMAFSRGDSALVVLSGQVAKAHPEELPRIVALANLPRGMRGKTLRNIFNPNVSVAAAALKISSVHGIQQDYILQ